MKSSFRIRELRRAAGLTQAQVAFRVGVKSPSAVTMWESGARRPSSELLPALARALHCGIEELYYSQDTTNSVQ